MASREQVNCCLCGSENNIEWHHLAWSPIQVRAPLCKPCHTKVHANTKTPKQPGKTLVIALDDETHEELSKLKDEAGLTWQGVLLDWKRLKLAKPCPECESLDTRFTGTDDLRARVECSKCGTVFYPLTREEEKP